MIKPGRPGIAQHRAIAQRVDPLHFLRKWFFRITLEIAPKPLDIAGPGGRVPREQGLGATRIETG
jgi:hypothetical protein